MSTIGKRDWRKKARQYLAAAFGGACTICGYDKTIAALDYHHVNPEQKDAALSQSMKNGHAWHKIVEEARKCTIVCCRCHREIHAGVTELPSDYAKFNEEYVDVMRLKAKEFDACPCCGQEKMKRQKYCSRECAAQSTRLFDITKEELTQLVEDHPYTTIGLMYGVSGNAIKKRCKLLEIPLTPKRGYWSRRKELDVSKSQMEEWLQTKSINAIANEIGTSHELVKKFVEEHEIEVPKINWHRVAGQARWRA